MLHKQTIKTALVATAFVLSLVVGLSAFAKGETGVEKSSEHGSVISNLATELNRIANRDGGIGKDLREVAKEQNESKNEEVDAMDQVENRSSWKTFFIGTDYKNLGILRSSLVKTANQIDRLTKAKARAADSAIVTELDKQITLLKAEKDKIELFIKDNEVRFSVFGWFIKLFNK